MKKKNISICNVIFNYKINKRIMQTPAFLQLFDRIPEIKNQIAISEFKYSFSVNNTHRGKIERMYSVFGCIQSIEFI